MARTKNLYELLGIPQTATSEEIKHAYRVLAMKWHPDRNTSAEAEERFKEINFAYSVLSDSVRRAEYDRNFEEFHRFEQGSEIHGGGCRSHLP